MTEKLVDNLAQEIRRVDGNNSLGAGALAEALMPFILSRTPAPAVNVGAVEVCRQLVDMLDSGMFMTHRNMREKIMELSAALTQTSPQSAGETGTPSPQADVLGKKHTGMKVDYRGLLNSARLGLRREPGIAEMLRQLEEHMTELGQRWYAGEAAVVDELLQLYCIESDARAALTASGGSTDV